MTPNLFCRACGSKLEPDARFCNGCGAQVTGQPSEPIKPQAAAVPAESARRPKRLWAYGVGIVLVAGLGYIAATPWLKLNQVKAMAEGRDFVGLVDQLGRDGIKQSVVQTLDDTFKRIREEDASAGAPPSKLLQLLPKNFGAELGKGIDKLLTPAALAEMQANSRTTTDAFNQFIDQKRQREAQAELSGIVDKVKVSASYVGINRFKMVASHPEYGAASMYLNRSGLLDWKLDRVDGSDMLALLSRKFGVAATPEQLANAALKDKRHLVAKRWVEIAANQGSADMQLKLGVMQLEGVSGTPPLVEQGIANLESAADKGNANAAYILAIVHESGFRVPKDTREALRWHEKRYQISPDLVQASQFAYRYALQGDFDKALEWKRIGMGLIEAEVNQRKLGVSAKKAEIARIAEAMNADARDLEAMKSSARKEDIESPWLKAFMGAGSSFDASSPIRLGMTKAEIDVLLGKPSKVESVKKTSTGEKSEFWYSYFHYVPETFLYLGFIGYEGNQYLNSIEFDTDLRYIDRQKPFLTEVRSQLLGSPREKSPSQVSRSPNCPISSGDLLKAIDSPLGGSDISGRTIVEYSVRKGVIEIGGVAQEAQEEISMTLCGNELYAFSLSYRR